MNVAKITCCTKDCPKRNATCHGTCKEYKEQKDALDEYNKIIKERKRAFNAPINFKIQQVLRMKKVMKYE